MVEGHVGLDLVGVRAGGRFPAGFFGGGVEVVGEVFGVGVPDLPLCGETGVGGGHIDYCESVGETWKNPVSRGERVCIRYKI